MPLVTEHNAAVDVRFPMPAERPNMRPTFMLVGVALTWENASGTPTAPTTSENVVVTTETDDTIFGVEIAPQWWMKEPAAASLTSTIFQVPEQPVPLPLGMVARVTYLNTDSLIVKVQFNGYWK